MECAGVAIFLKLWRALVKVATVPSPREIKIPGVEFVHPRSSRIGAGLSNAGYRPEDVEEIAGVPTVPFGSVRSNAHT